MFQPENFQNIQTIKKIRNFQTIQTIQKIPKTLHVKLSENSVVYTVYNRPVCFLKFSEFSENSNT